MDQDFEKRLLQQQSNRPICSPTLKSPPVSPFMARNFPCSYSASPNSLSPSTPDRCSDRFIPSRAGARWSIDFNVVDGGKANDITSKKEDSNNNDINLSEAVVRNQAHQSHNNENDKDANKFIYRCLLKNELLGAEIDHLETEEQNRTKRDMAGSGEKRNLFKYCLKTKKMNSQIYTSPYSLTRIGSNSQKLLRSYHKPLKKIAKVPYKVLDAPDLQDDFYLNLVDWSSSNMLGVALGPCVYMWSAHTGQVSCMCDLTSEADSVTSLQWNKEGDLLAVGTSRGYVQIWDSATSQKVMTFEGHSARVGALAWNDNQLSSGSRDRTIAQRDIRNHSSAIGNGREQCLTGHKQEICGLKWSPDGYHLASGGNDNKLMVWDAKSSSSNQSSPAQVYPDHRAAVKAIAWSPHQRGLLASGGGTADRFIRFWNTLSQSQVHSIDTESQVCNLAWSCHANEFVSTHGYSHNEIVLWSYPSLTQITRLTGHTSRVLYLATSPDGESIVTGAGDETLRFWNIFTKTPVVQKQTSVLNLFTHIR